MDRKGARLNIGMPVFNGASYIEMTLDSLLAQTFTDFELIISDNASTDATQQICEAYAARDPRIRYHRNQKNIGATQNWYRVFELSSGDYFASVAHDDIYEPDYMKKCIEVLEKDLSIGVCYTKTAIIDEFGNSLGLFDVEVDTTSSKPHVRFYNIIARDYLCIQLYGVMRSSILRAARMFVGYYGCDRNTLAELSLMGKLYEIPEHLFIHRLYPGALGVAMNSGRTIDELFALDPGKDWKNRYWALTIYRNYFTSVSRLVNSPVERIKCYMVLKRLIVEKMIRRLTLLLRKKTT